MARVSNVEEIRINGRVGGVAGSIYIYTFTYVEGIFFLNDEKYTVEI